MTSLVGLDHLQRSVLRAFQSHKMHHAWLLTGSSGRGKASFAMLAAQHLLSREPDYAAKHFDPDFSGPGGAMLKAANHPDLYNVVLEPKDDKERAKKDKGTEFEVRRNITVDQVRTLQRKMSTRPSLGVRRVIIIDAIDNMEHGAANALLKSLEEPPENTLFFLVAHNPGKLLPTIRSRCLTLSFPMLESGDMRTALKCADENLTDAQIETLVDMGQGAPGHALAFSDIGMDEIHKLMQNIAQTGDPHQVHRTKLSKLLIGKASKKKFDEFVSYAPVFTADYCRTANIDNLQNALSVWEELLRLSKQAPTYNFNTETLVYQIGGLLARLAPPRQAAA